MSSSSPVRTPKLQLDAQQPSTGEYWIPPRKDTPCPRAKEKPQQDSRRGETTFGIKPHICRDAQRAQTKPCVHQDPETPKRLSQTCLSVFCKTQNSGLRSKEEKPRDPINQPSRCSAQEGLLSVVQTGDSDLLGGRAHQTANWVSFLYAKKNILSAYYIQVTK